MTRKKILIIEDEEYLAGVLMTKLEKEGYAALIASDGESGLEKIKEWSPDLILLDIMLPKLNGYKVLEKLHKEGNKIPVIIISNSGQPIELEKIKKLGAVDYLVKVEFDPQEVLDKIKKNIKKSKGDEKVKQEKKAKAKIILAEDEQFLRELCEQQLTKAGFEVISVINGAKALKLIMEEKPDLVLLDIILPTVDGFKILKEIRKSPNSKVAKTPVIMLSNLGQISDVDKAKKLGANQYLVKSDFTVGEIVKEVEKMLEKFQKKKRD